MPLNEQEKLIGKHPDSDGFFSEWLSHNDCPTTATLKHRELNPDSTKRQEAIDKLSNWIVCHHVNESKIRELQAKKRILKKYGFKSYFDNQTLLPSDNTTRKGNGAEVILAEYLVCTSNLDLLVYKLHYNPNIEQSMKGDDVLLLKQENIEEKIIVGESKFRTTPSKAVVDEINNSFGNSTVLPISLGFIVDRLREKGERGLAKEVADLQANLHRGRTDIVNVGFVMSNQNTHNHVSTHGNTNNSKLAFVSLAIEDPDVFISECFEKAVEKLEGIKKCPISQFPIEYAGELVNARVKDWLESLKTIIPL